MPRPRPGVLVLAVLLVPALIAPLGAQAQESFTLGDVAWLAGCWTGDTGTVQLREHWTEAQGGVMLGSTRFFRDGAVVDWEFGRIHAEGDGVVLWPYPRGSMSEHGFRLVRASPALVFENLEHDFPVRIIYTPTGTDALAVRAEGADGRGQQWSATRTQCP